MRAIVFALIALLCLHSGLEAIVGVDTSTSVTVDSVNVNYVLHYGVKPTWTRIYIDTDRVATTGFPIDTIGANFLIENGVLFRYTGVNDTSWTLVQSVPSFIGDTSANVSVALVDIGSPTTVDSVTQHAYPPTLTSSKITTTAPSAWRTGTWSVCSVSCGTGVQTRLVQCISSAGAVVADTACSPTSTKPLSQQTCASRAMCPVCRDQLPLSQIGTTPSANLQIIGQKNLVIDGRSFTFTSGQQNCLYIASSQNITVRRSSFTGCYRGILIDGGSNVLIEDNYFENTVAGVMALTTTSSVKVQNNRIKNTGGGSWYSMTSAFDQAVNPNAIAFNKVQGTGNEISCNLVQNIEGSSKSEDLMTAYLSQGTSASPILIQNNCLKGGGPSPSGGGIMVGDQGGKYIIAQNNTLINVGQYSMAISGGHYNQLLNNKIYARARTGYPLDTGIYVHDYGNSLDGTGCSSNTVQGNQVNCISSGGTNCGAASGTECGVIAGWNQNIWGIPGTTTTQGPDLSSLSCPF